MANGSSRRFQNFYRSTAGGVKPLLSRIKDIVLASVYGVVVIAILQGALCGSMFRVLGIRAPALWGAVTVFASVLPVVGAFAVWGPGTLYLALTGAWSHAIVLAIWGTFVVSGIDNVLRPRLVAGRVGLSIQRFADALGADIGGRDSDCETSSAF